MQETEIHKLASDYLAFFRGGQRLDQPEMFSLGKISRLCQDEASLGFKVAWVIANSADADNAKALASLGTGPLKDLMRCHGEEMLGLLLEAARENANFCVALSCVWKNAVDEGLWSQLSEGLHAIRTSHGDQLLSPSEG
ncbi:DUF6869 domain-containing protein [Kordiimonas marina]|uniref:DUF6869 domain-containing protein n=1 Tax=Kordiimonas marina TaxID=2872312 RepID=UPI001FF507E9|nr:hypothetical protein [Kordiimonas marina]MCJ9429454.1 hypothetical protein [Kordiimonas marina]